MWFKSIDLRNVYSFGPLGTSELKDFKQFNLFIGKNGSGKSNVFRAMCDLDVISIYDRPTNTFCYQLGNKSISRNVLPDLIVREPRDSQSSQPNSNNDIVIELEYHNITFRNRLHVKGNFKHYSAGYISHDPSILSFKDKLNNIGRSNSLPAILSFCVTYIFQLDFSFREGSITEWFTIQDNADRGTDGIPVGNFEDWSSGFFSVSNLLMDYFQTRGGAVCIDEPEVHLEPRILRRVFEIMIWISNRGKIPLIGKSSELFDKIEKKWVDWFKKSSWKEINEWKIEGTKKSKARQIFLSSHSTVLIDEFLKYPELCSIYEFDRSLNDTTFLISHDKKRARIQRKSIVSHVRQIVKYPHSILDNLGAKGSDILQANGIIWVEGPSDVVYIKKWLDMYIAENELPKLIQGTHYEFQMYGGTLLDSLCLMKNDHSEEDELKKLVSMFSFSRNAYLITDSDAIRKDDGTIVDQSNFKKAKEFVANEFEKLSKNNYNLGLWYKKDNTEIRTLENYLDDKTIEDFRLQSKSGLTKKIYAQKVTQSWDNRTLADFKFSLSEEIKVLYETIAEWNK
ncbi:MAG: AAA family ATPase [Flavobacteriales bacterium]|nr:AAA family ATPase [Flavobacteriales bacterium]